MTIMKMLDYLGRGPLTRGPTPLWFQLADRLRRPIEERKVLPGEQLPTESELMERFSVGRSTVRAAMSALEADGLVWRGAGKGTFVAETPTEHLALTLSGYHNDTRRRGHEPSTRTLKFERRVPPPHIAARLGLDATDTAIYLERLLLADETLIGLQRSYMPELVLAGGEIFTVEEGNTEIYDLLRDRAGIIPKSATQVVEATGAPADIADLLGVTEGAPVLQLTRLVFDQNDRPFSHGNMTYRAGLYQLEVPLIAQGTTRKGVTL